MQNLHITFLIHFSFVEGILYMPCNDRLVFIKQFCHLALCKPHGIFLQLYFKLGIAVICRIEYNRRPVIRNKSILFHTCSSLL